MNLDQAADQVRVEESQELRRGLFLLLTRTRWGLPKRPEHLTSQQEIKLAQLLRANLRTVGAYLLKEDLGFLWTCQGLLWARPFLRGWCHRLPRFQIKPLKSVAPMLRAHEPLLLNCSRVRKQISGGPTEGPNNRLQLALRKAYGFRILRMAEIALGCFRRGADKSSPVNAPVQLQCIPD